MTNATPHKQDTVGANRQDAYLCYCEEVTDTEFLARIAANPDISLEQLCAETGVASKCTACLLNAEDLFVAAPRDGAAAADTGPAKRKHTEGWSRQRFYRVLDAVSPDVARTVPGIIPIIAGPGVSTTLAFANIVPPVIGDRAPAFDLRVEIRDAEGRVVSRKRGRVERGSRVEFDISRGLAGPSAGDELITGACFLSYRAAEPGYLGGIRPHFKVSTPRAVTSVHSAAGGRRDTYFETRAVNAAERQYVSAVNCTRKPARIDLFLVVDGEERPAGTWTVPPLGARLISVPDEAPRDTVFGILAKADREMRWHFAVAEGDPPRISIDHI